MTRWRSVCSWGRERALHWTCNLPRDAQSWPERSKSPPGGTSSSLRIHNIFIINRPLNSQGNHPGAFFTASFLPTSLNTGIPLNPMNPPMKKRGGKCEVFMLSDHVGCHLRQLYVGSCAHLPEYFAICFSVFMAVSNYCGSSLRPRTSQALTSASSSSYGSALNSSIGRL